MARYMKAAEDRSTVHPRRSLDEASFRHHDYENLMKRNNDQVVTRFLEKEERKGLHTSNNEQLSNDLTLMMVDQLWLWVLDEGTQDFHLQIITEHSDRSLLKSRHRCH
jgi:hypothetical protein